MEWWMWLLLLAVLGVIVAPIKLRILKKMMGKNKE